MNEHSKFQKFYWNVLSWTRNRKYKMKRSLVKCFSSYKKNHLMGERSHTKRNLLKMGSCVSDSAFSNRDSSVIDPHISSAAQHLPPPQEVIQPATYPWNGLIVHNKGDHRSEESFWQAAGCTCPQAVAWLTLLRARGKLCFTALADVFGNDASDNSSSIISQ